MPRQRARPAPWRLSSEIAPSAWAWRSNAASRPVGVRIRARAASAAAWRAPGWRRDQRRRAERVERVVGGLAGVAGIGGDLARAVTGKAGAPDQRLQRVGLAAGRALGLDGDDHPPLGINGDLAAMDQMRALPGLVAQLAVGVGPRNRGRVGRCALRRRPGPRLGQRQRRPRLGPPTLAVTVAVAVVVAGLDHREFGAKTLQRGVSLDVCGVDQQPLPADQPRLVHWRNTR